MMHRVFPAFLLLVFTFAAPPSFWPEWRGPLRTGAALGAHPPLRWAEGSNVLWKAAIPGRGHSTPIVWKEHIFLTSAVETDQAADPEKVRVVEAETPEFHRKQAFMPTKALQFMVLALKRSDGREAWKKTLLEEMPFSATHGDGSWASSSPATDGERLYVYFGSYGLYCLTLDGKRLWEKRFGPMKMKANFGEGITPVLCGDLLIVNLDQEGESSLLALDKKTGAEKWRVARDEATSWSTPLVVDHRGKRQIVVSATKKIRSYDATSGKILWECGGMTGNVIPCPLYDGERVICMSGFRGSALLAISLDKAAGDITGNAEAIAWSTNKDTPYTPSPILSGGLVYYLRANDGLLSCVEAATGKPAYEAQRLEGIKVAFSSPIEAGGRLYVSGKEGKTVVAKAGRDFDVLAVNSLEDKFTASAVAVDGQLFLRGWKNLYCLAEKAGK